MREPVLFECLAHDRDSLLVNETGNGVLHHALVVRQLRSNVKQIEGVEGRFTGSHGSSLCAMQVGRGVDSKRTRLCGYTSLHRYADAPVQHGQQPDRSNHHELQILQNGQYAAAAVVPEPEADHAGDQQASTYAQR